MERHDAEPGRGIHVHIARGEQGTHDGYVAARGGFGERGSGYVGGKRCERGGLARRSGCARFGLRDRNLGGQCD
jgi:hypothetical protein